MERDQTPRPRHDSLCPCKSREPYGLCCEPFHLRKAHPETAEQLMRSRYSAYFFRLVDYIVETTHPDTKSPELVLELRRTIDAPKWTFLTILGTSKGQAEDKVGKVEFVAECYLEGTLQQLHEHSRFKRFKGLWKYLDDKG
jgi:SEC-C motif-containing protein